MDDDSGGVRPSGTVHAGAGRRRRLAVIGVVASVLVLTPVVVSAIGSRRAAAEISRLRLAAGSATVTAAEIAAAASGGVEADPVASALGVGDGRVSAFSATGAQWCISVEVDRLLTTRSIHFRVDASGRWTETSRCDPP